MTGMVRFNALLFVLFVSFVSVGLCALRLKKVFEVVLLVTGLRMLVQSFL